MTRARPSLPTRTWYGLQCKRGACHSLGFRWMHNVSTSDIRTLTEWEVNICTWRLQGFTRGHRGCKPWSRRSRPCTYRCVVSTWASPHRFLLLTVTQLLVLFKRFRTISYFCFTHGVGSYVKRIATRITESGFHRQAQFTTRPPVAQLDPPSLL